MQRRDTRWSAAASFAVHGFFCAVLLGGWHFARPIKVVQHLPGTSAGTQLTLSYSPGGAPPAVTTALHAPRALASPAKVSRIAKTAPSTAEAAAPGVGSGGQSSLGDGDISIALVRTHPRPAPDLSGLPHGTAGDVVLDVVIDEQGRIADAKVERGLGGAIDQLVLATVREQWTFAPATRNGVAIASEQELLFHYERG